MTTSKSDDTPKAFARLFRYKEITEKKRQEKLDAKREDVVPVSNEIKRQLMEYTYIVIQKEDLKIKKGERIKDFNERVNKKYQQEFIQAVKSTKPLSERKRKNREARKQKQQEKKQRQLEQYGGRDFDDLKDEVKFGEVANAPPIFTKIPKARGRGKEVLSHSNKQTFHADPV